MNRTSSSRPARFPAAAALWLHAALLLIALSVLVPIVNNGHIALMDEGVYLAQARNLENGAWSRVRSTSDVDLNGDFEPVTEGGVNGDRVVAYFKHPLYPLLITPAYMVGGVAGVMMLSVIGTCGAALSAAFLASRLKPSYGVWALWIVGLGSPLIFDAYLAIAHSIAAAFAGFAVLGVVRAIDDRQWINLSYALPCVALLTAVRSEGLILAVVLAVVVSLMALGWPPLRRTDRPGLFVAVSILGTAAITYMIESRLAHSIVGTDSLALKGGSPTQRLTLDSLNPISGLWASVLTPFSGSWIDAKASVILIFVSIVMSAIAIRLAPMRRLFPLGLLVLAALSSLWLMAEHTELIGGLLPAFPILAMGMICLPYRGLDGLTAKILLGVSFGTAALIAMVNYGSGSNLEWGGRYFHVTIPLLGPLVVCGIDNAFIIFTKRERRLGITCLGLVSLVMSFWALKSQIELRSWARQVNERVEAAVEKFDPDGQSSIVVTLRVQADGVARTLWDFDGRLLAANGLASFPALLSMASHSGQQRLIIVTSIVPSLLESPDIGIHEMITDAGWRITSLSSALNQGYMGTVMVLDAS